MRRILLLCVISFALCLFGCAQSHDTEPNTESNASEPNIESEASDYKFTSLCVEYPFYKDTAEIVGASEYIYTGTVKDITFEIIDMKTGKTDNSSDSASTDRMLYTVYTISLINSVKGDNPSETKICTMGGMVGYKEAEQYGKMEASGLLNEYGGIPTVAEGSALSIGGEYLFYIANRAEGNDLVVNLTQFAQPKVRIIPHLLSAVLFFS